jgi:beta-lactam-binding protein with PASTA domain
MDQPIAVAETATEAMVIAQDPAAGTVVPEKSQISVQVAGPVGPC